MCRQSSPPCTQITACCLCDVNIRWIWLQIKAHHAHYITQEWRKPQVLWLQVPSKEVQGDVWQPCWQNAQNQWEQTRRKFHDEHQVLTIKQGWFDCGMHSDTVATIPSSTNPWRHCPPPALPVQILQSMTASGNHEINVNNYQQKNIYQHQTPAPIFNFPHSNVTINQPITVRSGIAAEVVCEYKTRGTFPDALHLTLTLDALWC